MLVRGALDGDGCALRRPRGLGRRGSAAAAAGSSGVAWRQAHLVEYLATTGVVNQPPGNNHLKDNSNNTFIGTVQNALLLFPRRP